MRRGSLVRILLVALLTPPLLACGVSGNDVQVNPVPGSSSAASTPGGDGADPLPVTPQLGVVGSHAIRWDRYEVVDERTVRIFFSSGIEPCYVLANVDVAYQPAEVRITLLEGSDARSAGQTCIELAVAKVVSVTLEQPLAGRAVVDGQR